MNLSAWQAGVLLEVVKDLLNQAYVRKAVLASLDKVDLRSLPTELAVRHVKGNGSRVLYVFSDPMCGFCKALEQSLPELDNATVYTFLTPILGAESKRLAAAISCGRSRCVWARLWSRRQRATSAWLPDISTSGTATPSYITGRV